MKKISPALTGGNPKSVFDRLRDVLRSKDETTADALQREVDLATEARDAARATRVALEARRADMVIEDDDVRARHRADLAAAADSAADLQALLERLEARVITAREAEEQARRSAAYSSARQAAEAFSQTWERDYRKVVVGLMALLREGARIGQQVEKANAALPAGAVPLSDPEVLARAIPGTPEKVVSETEVVLWARIDDLNRPIPEEFQNSVQSTGKGWGKRKNDLEPVYRRATYRQTTVQKPSYTAFPGYLSAELQLPGLRGAIRPLWSRQPWLAGDFASVLAGVADVDAQLDAKAEKPRVDVEVRYEMVSAHLPEDGLLEEPQVVERSRVVQSEYMAREAHSNLRIQYQ